MKITIYTMLGVILTSTGAWSQDLAFSIRANSQLFKVRDQVVFTFTYTNTSSGDIGIYPEYYAYQALDTYFVKTKGKQKGQMIGYLSPAQSDCAVLAKKFRILRPRESYSRKLAGRFSTSLPPDVRPDKRAGLYILFADSAVGLPGFGKYSVSSCYVGLKEYGECLDAEKKRRVWVGKVCAAPIDVDVRQ